MNRPFGVTVIGILALISGLFGLCWPILIFTGSAFLGPIFGTIGVIAGIFLIIGPLLHLIFAYGAFNLRSWAWYLGLIASGITVIGVVINLIQGGPFWSTIWGSVLSIIIFIYLLSANVRLAFGVAPQAPAAPPAPAGPPAPTTSPPTPAETPEPGDEAQE